MTDLILLTTGDDGVGAALGTILVFVVAIGLGKLYEIWHWYF